MRAPSSRIRRIAALTTGPVAVLLAGAMVWQGSNAAFSASTRNAGNNWSSGSVALTDDDNGVAGFNVQNLVPGATGEKCIVVTAKSPAPGEVRAYVQNLTPSAQGLEKHILLEVTKGTGGSFNDCSGFTADPPDPLAPGPLPLDVIAANRSDFATGGASWMTDGVASGESKTYKGTWKFDTTGLTQSEINALQGGTTSIDLVWELQTDE